MSDLFDTIKGIFSGETPIERQERKPGESKYYLINPGQEGKRFSELETTDIPDEEEKEEFYIRDDKNYKWDMPKKYDRRPNILGTFNNFVKINCKVLSCKITKMMIK